MPKTTLTYFDAPVSRGEECRIALFLAGVPFEDERLNGARWADRVRASPYGALPYLTIEGKGRIAQSNAILRYVGAEHGMYPTDPWEAAQQDALMGAVEDLRGRIGPTNRVKDPEAKKLAREELAKVHIPEWATFVEQKIQGPFFSGEKLYVGDLKIFVTMTPLKKGAIDHIPASVFDGYPKLNQLFEAVKAHPRVAAWYAR